MVGVDISQAMIDHAAAAAPEQDLANARLMVGFLTDEKWRHVIAKMLRVLVRGGTVVLTENDDMPSNSPALETLKLHAYRSARRAGLSHHPLGHHFGVTPLLGHYLQQAGSIPRPAALTVPADLTGA